MIRYDLICDKGHAFDWFGIVRRLKNKSSGTWFPAPIAVRKM